MPDPATSKVTPRLAERLAATADDDVVEVVVELRPPDDVADDPTASRAERIAARREAFDELAEAVADRIASVAGTVVDRAWINSTMRVSLPAHGVDDLASDDLVDLVDDTTLLSAE